MAYFFLLIVGLVVGSFLNVCIDRIPRGESIVSPPSHCDSCGHALSVIDLVPLLSYVFLRGRCRYCTAPVSWRMPAVELASGFLFVAIGAVAGWGVQLIPALLYGSLFLLIMVIDLETQLIPDRIILPAIPVVWVLSILWPLSDAARSSMGVLPLALPGGDPTLALVQSMAGGLVAFLIMLLPFLVYPDGMGGGDVKLAAVVGLATGFPLVFVALFVSFLSGGVVGGALLLSGIKGRKDPIPFGPFLAAAGILALFWGDALLRWYWTSLTV